MDKVFPDDLLDVILNTTFKRHGIEADKIEPDSNNIEKLRTTSLELLGRVDEFLRRSKEEEVEETKVPVESVPEEQVEVSIEVKPKPDRRSFWGHL